MKQLVPHSSPGGQVAAHGQDIVFLSVDIYYYAAALTGPSGHSHFQGYYLVQQMSYKHLGNIVSGVQKIIHNGKSHWNVQLGLNWLDQSGKKPFWFYFQKEFFGKRLPIFCFQRSHPSIYWDVMTHFTMSAHEISAKILASVYPKSLSQFWGPVW
jgi:hypothetical protein